MIAVPRFELLTVTIAGQPVDVDLERIYWEHVTTLDFYVHQDGRMVGGVGQTHDDQWSASAYPSDHPELTHQTFATRDEALCALILATREV